MTINEKFRYFVITIYDQYEDSHIGFVSKKAAKEFYEEQKKQYSDVYLVKVIKEDL